MSEQYAVQNHFSSPELIVRLAIGIITGLIGCGLLLSGQIVLAFIPFLLISILSLLTIGHIYLFKIPYEIEIGEKQIVLVFRVTKKKFRFSYEEIQWMDVGKDRNLNYGSSVKVKSKLTPFLLVNAAGYDIKDHYRKKIGRDPPIPTGIWK